MSFNPNSSVGYQGGGRKKLLFKWIFSQVYELYSFQNNSSTLV